MSNHPQYPTASPHPSDPAGGPHGGHANGHFAPYDSPAHSGIPPFPAGLADLGSRLGARVLDLIFWYVAYMATGGIWLSMWIDAGGGSTAQSLLAAWLLVSGTLYFPVCIWKFGQTLGKRICHVRIVRRESGQAIGFWRAMGREVLWPVVSFIPVLGLLNTLWCCWDRPYRQCLHDKVADTVAVAR
ncbi:RDD family protein [Streptomyces sp. SS7]|uniref:RDD family protein n=1 Tax=Streptomyces sp. SS7 TaxID=3108485 RepID=UPI0030EB5F9F